jgi:hypothetical protein
VIHRNAMLALRTDLEAGHEVHVQLSTGVVPVSELVGVLEDSHAIVMSDGARVLIPLEQIVAVAISNVAGDSTEALYD